MNNQKIHHCPYIRGLGYTQQLYFWLTSANEEGKIKELGYWMNEWMNEYIDKLITNKRRTKNHKELKSDDT